jgi:HAMP domain-containing protein
MKAYHGVLVTVGLLACVLVLGLAVGLLLLRRYVMAPLESITRSAHAYSLGGPAPVGARTIRASGQLYDLEQAISRLRTSLDEAMRMLAGRERNR